MEYSDVHVRKFPADLLERISQRAKRQRRSRNEQIIYLVELGMERDELERAQELNHRFG
jgi:hypothetical protein